MSFQSLPFSINYAKYLGLEDRIIVAGNDTNGSGVLQILQYHANTASMRQIDSNSPSYVVVATSALKNSSFHTYQLGSIARSGQTFVLLSCESDSGSSIYLANIESSLYDMSINLSQMKSTMTSSLITSISYHSDHEAIASSAEDGRVTVHAIDSGHEISSFTADAAGVNKVHYLRSGYILTTGISANSSTLKLWDIRVNNMSVFGDRQPAQEYKHNLARSEVGDITSIANHPVHDHLMCGTSTGLVTSWDLRSSNHFSFKPHKSKGIDF
jgi:hypothetical protein